MGPHTWALSHLGVPTDIWISFRASGELPALAPLITFICACLTPSPSCSRLGQYVVPAGQRWVCVFGECWSRLGCDAAGRGDRSVAWENIAVSITAARRQR